MNTPDTISLRVDREQFKILMNEMKSAKYRFTKIVNSAEKSSGVREAAHRKLMDLEGMQRSIEYQTGMTDGWRLTEQKRAPRGDSQ